MVAAVSDWLRHLVLLILLAVLVELVLPDNALQKYARAVFGLLIMLAMLDPLRALMHAGFSAAAFSRDIAGPLVTAASEQTTNAANVTYQADVSHAIAVDVAATLGVHLVSVQVVTGQHADGSVWVTGIRAMTPIMLGRTTSTMQAREIQAQISELMGLPLQSVSVVDG